MEKQFSEDSLRSVSITQECVSRLAAELPCEYPLAEIIAIVMECQQDLSGEPASALPELVERLARYRIFAAASVAEPPEPVGA